MLEWLFRRRRPETPLRGAPPVRREKTYSSATGYVYQYYYEGYREAQREAGPGREYVFHVTSDRKASFPLTVFLAQAVVEAWQTRHGRELSATEQYAAVKMTLFQTFDERADLGAATADCVVGDAAIEEHLATLEID